MIILMMVVMVMMIKMNDTKHNEPWGLDLGQVFLFHRSILRELFFIFLGENTALLKHVSLDYTI